MKKRIIALTTIISSYASANQVGGTTSYPIVQDLAKLKRETAAVCQDGVPEENTSGLSKIICTIKNKLRATSVGSFGPIDLGAKLLSSAKLTKESDGYYKIDQWSYESNTPQQAQKSVQYRFSEDGQKGRVEKMDIPRTSAELQSLGFTKWTAAVYEWDSTNPAAQKLLHRKQQTKDGLAKTYANTRWAESHLAVIDSNKNMAELVSISYAGDAGQSYKFRSLRNSTHTLFEAYICNAAGSSCFGRTFQCVVNSTNIIESLGASYAEVRTGGCAFFPETGFTMALEEPTQTNLDIINDTSGRLMTLKTDEAMTP